MSETTEAASALPKPSAKANPTKAFFVRMITRDITLDDCILDLIDNSIDGAWRLEGSRPMGLSDGTDLSKYTISITTSPDRFVITDNCGGMTLEDAVEHAFSFGRHAADKHDDFSIGVYGIGMKRAVFKLGTDIRVRSTYFENGTQHSFAVPIKVNDWIKNDDPPWDFDLVEDECLERNGVEIVVQDLIAGAKNSFLNPAFLLNLRRTIARDYSLHLRRGLAIYLNGSPIRGNYIEFLESSEFKPMRRVYKDSIDDSEVEIEIIGGMAAPPPESIDPTEDNDGDRRFGWYVICNGRIVLAADKTAVSGWGVDGWQQWHYQYAGFIGVILFTAADAAALPLTTTKRSIDNSSEVFRRARPKMREVSQAWIGYTNQRKQALDEARQKEEKATPVALHTVGFRALVALPSLGARPTTQRVANVNYSVPLSKMRRLAQAMERSSLTNREVGLRSFSYAYDDMVGKE